MIHDHWTSVDQIISAILFCFSDEHHPVFDTYTKVWVCKITNKLIKNIMYGNYAYLDGVIKFV